MKKDSSYHKVRRARKEAAQGNHWLALSAITRIVLSLLLGTAAAVVTGIFFTWLYAPLVLWDVTATVLIFGLWLSLRAFDAKQTEPHATTEDPGRGAADAVLMLASLASLVAVVVLIAQSKEASGAAEYMSVGLAVVSVIISWAAVHSMNILRYADLYFKTKKGIDFNGAAPTYTDFAYLSFTIGMTYQVSDTSIKAPEIRRAILFHALLSYLFGTAIIASMINLVVSLAQ